MTKRCSVCGRELTKTAGPIGPRCLQKMKPRNIRGCHKTTKAQRTIIATQYDMFEEKEEEENGQE